MLKGAVAGRYAEALYEIALEADMVNQLEQELTAVVKIINTSDELKRILFHPRIIAADKKEVLSNLFKGQVAEITMHFLGLLVERNREIYLENITDYYTSMANKARNIADVQVTSAIELTKDQKTRLVKAMEKCTGKQVRLSYHQDAGLIGGMVVRVGDKVIDSSVRTRLQTLQEHLKEIS